MIDIISKTKYFFVVAVIFVVAGCFSAKTLAQNSSDAIAIRIIPNPNHYSALRWYKESDFNGSPQSTTVDGYEAVRDGRTVYVNAGNVQNGNLYTYIYLISYNQGADSKTMDIFSSILARWKFNTNLNSSANCSVSTATECLLDTDCQLAEYCLSEKAEIIRDTKRMADLAEVKANLEKYEEKNAHYPNMRAGSYLRNITISTWPSWQKVLEQELAVSLPVDPINKLGNCGNSRFNPITCWDKNAKEFADRIPANNVLDLPDNSRVFVYTTNSDGTNYDLCAFMESVYAAYAETGICAN